jgi:hypothetical protein
MRLTGEKFHRLTKSGLVGWGVETLLREVVMRLISIDSTAAKATARIPVGQTTQVYTTHEDLTRFGWMVIPCS